ncbi:uncharacterized protein LOC127244367 isoform X2 [Andrographis paniculata]|uniref:uncharacterized protein LOC127244367 isoform X2 n=1 Tax=Andrographis paniculata TaxID=175694 RepID=UPI0021E737F7|nr:uncharacterized protein LOC127244367 isoform X2 [Andrographis paniculata]
MDKGFWMAKGSDHLADGDTVFDNASRKESKRAPREWFLDASEPELFPSKKQAVEATVGKTESGIAMLSSLPWENSSRFLSMPSVTSPFLDGQFESDIKKPITLTDRNMPMGMMDGSNVRKVVRSEHFENDPSVGLSISYAMEDPETELSYGGLRKVKVNQVKDPENGLHTSMEHGIGISMDHSYPRANENTFISMGQPNIGNHASLIGHSYDVGEANIRTIGSTFEKGLSNNISLPQSYNKGDSNTLSFGGYQDESVMEALSRPITSYGLLYEQSSTPTSEIPSKKMMDALNNGANLSTYQGTKPKVDSLSKNKLETKPTRKEAPNSFPSNVRSLIATGMLDGVPVKYVSVSREELRGIIKGSGYLCGCQSCNYSKALNAYEFERHAGCKTKHPNNHIYFENGKTIYQIVQELRSTPESMLFDAIQTSTGSPINQKAFRTWKESFQAATRELQRIYGKDELNL